MASLTTCQYYLSTLVLLGFGSVQFSVHFCECRTECVSGLGGRSEHWTECGWTCSYQSGSVLWVFKHWTRYYILQIYPKNKSTSHCSNCGDPLQWHDSGCLINGRQMAISITSLYNLQCREGLWEKGAPMWYACHSCPTHMLYSSLVNCQPSSLPIVMSECTALLSQKSGFRGVSDSGFSLCAAPTYYCRSEYFYSQCP